MNKFIINKEMWYYYLKLSQKETLKEHRVSLVNTTKYLRKKPHQSEQIGPLEKRKEREKLLTCLIGPA